MEALAVAFVALVGVWCMVVLPAMWLSGTMSQDEELARSETGQSSNESVEEPKKEV